jgi:arsenite methyltransferase
LTDYLDTSIDYSTAEFAATFDELPFWSARFGTLLLDQLELRGGITAIDLACGTGFPLFELARRHDTTSRFYGVDLWTTALTHAEKKRRVYGASNVVLVYGSGAALPFAASTVDLITSNLGINNFDDKQAAFAECARVLRPDGRLAITTNLRGNMAEFYTAFRHTLTDLGLTEILDRLTEHENHRGTPETVATLFTDAGFAAVRLVEDSFSMRFQNGSAFFHHWLIRVGFLPAWRALLPPSDERRVFATLEDRLNAAGELQFTIPMLYAEGMR